ncbi:hypothetical protein BDR06DRAFT_967528 [Suillus hirtellus]|nr:hypothetical protein BDR06DRAFT_967528 [Suillus hirtellus]
MMIYQLMSWMNSGSNKKSELEVARLVKEVLLAKDFDPMHLENFSVRGTLRKLDKDHSGNKVEFPDDWTHATVAIKIPTKLKEDDGRLFSIPGFHFRPLIDVIRSAFVDIQAKTSRSMLTLRQSPAHVTWWDFCLCIAYQLPDKVKDIFRSLPRISKSGMAALHTHCRRELFHGCWEILLDKDFLHAYRHGIVLRIFPRIFTYSADYPENDMRSRISSLRVYVATNVIRACEFIYQGGNTVDGKKVEETLGRGSWAPILNKFVERLGSAGPRHISDACRGLDARVRVGILYVLPNGNQLVANLDSRFRQIPTFGNGVIRMFSNNTSEMKRLAARDFEDILQDTFKKLSKQLRRFCNFTCAVFDTVELPKEKVARQRRVAQHAGPNSIPLESSRPRVKVFNLSTYKFHTMGDYLRTIKLFGTTDSFTTRIGELAHRAIKAFYPLTSKVDTPAQLAKHEHRRRVLRRVVEAANISSNQQSPADSHASSLFQDHHFIADNRNDPVSLFTFLREHDSDPATKTMQIHYTTYNMMREYDTISPRTHPDVMVLSGEASPSHPYWYARVLGIYRIDTWIKGVCRTEKHHLEVLYVRWLAPLISSDYESGIQHARLPKLVFVEESDHDAFGFLNPGQVIRGAHLIPAFTSGRGVSSLCYGKSLAHPKEELTDWEAYYVRIFVDWDMFLRYTSLGVGHPVALRKIVRNCFDLESATPATEDMDVDGSRSDSEDHRDDDEQRMDDGLSREESDDFEGIEIEGEEDEGEEDGEEGEEDEGEEGEGEEDEGEEDEREDFDDELDDELSF